MTTFDQIKQIISHSGFDSDLITPTALLDDDIGLYSLDVVEIVLKAGEHFDIQIRDEVLAKISTVQDAVDAVDHALSNRGVVG